MIISLVGNVGNVRTFTGEDGKKVVVFSVAVDQKGTTPDGGKQAPIWYSFRAANGLAETLSQYLTKGRLVYVAGTSPRLRTYEVERQLNVPGVGVVRFKDQRQDVEYLVTDFRFLDAPAAQVVEAQVVQAATVVSQPAAQAAQAAPTQTAQVVQQAAQLPDDLPF